MDWPHDPDGERGSDGRRAYGHAILATLVAEESFPVAVSTVRESYGSYPVRIDRNRVVSVAEILECVDREQFDSLQAFHQAMGAAMRAGGYQPYDPP